MASLSQELLLQLIWVYSLPTTYLGTNTVTTFARRQILLLAYLDAFYLAVPPQVKKTAYCMLVVTKLEYASSVWNPHTKSNVDKIEMVQRRAARFVCHDYSRYSHVSTLINALGWESLEQRRLNNHVCMFYKIYSGLVGITLPAEINPVTRVSRYPNCAPFQQLITLNYTYKYSFYPRTIRT